MSSKKLKISTSSEDDENKHAMIMDERKRKRMISNRESARRSRMKREQHVKDLNDEITYLTTKCSELAQKITEIAKNYAAIESENRVLSMHGEELKKRLELMEEMLLSCNNNIYYSNIDNDLSYVSMVNSDDYSGMTILEDPLLKQWLQPTFKYQTI
ncbi:hypothetical protein BUALT_Bualt14G0124300 [Buddleja alternifolia]|uniref:BZIP domain-containing protein n=1 Tax=Buddleja alternifolia TaxID=168488 RepID=A0AAV6WK85_9LAMI|nr:hypothetical protein BUALT_Bualt14G0124300 [Buddleja alternifolia]